MKSIFATIYETWFGLYNSNYSLIFDVMFEDGGYIKMGLLFLFVPLLFWIGFYYLVRYPYAHFGHWIAVKFFVVAVVVVLTFVITSNAIFGATDQRLISALADQNSGYALYADPLVYRYGIFNGLLAMIVGFIYSLIFKQFSKAQMHLPF